MMNQPVFGALTGSIVLALAGIAPQTAAAAGCQVQTCLSSATLLNTANVVGSGAVGSGIFTFTDQGRLLGSLQIQPSVPLELAGGTIVQAASPTLGLTLNRQLGSRELNFSSRRATGYANRSVGLSFGDVSLQFSSGQSDNHYASTPSLFTGVAPNLFHGNIEQRYQYNSFGAAMSTGANFDLLAVSGKIASDNVDDRSVQAFGFAGDNLSVLWFQAARDRQTTLNGLVVNTLLGDWLLGYEELHSTTDIRYQRFSSVFTGSTYGVFGLALERVQNPLYTDATEQRVMLTFSRSFGGQQPVFSVKRRRVTKRAERSRRNRNLAIVALAAIPVAALASGGGGTAAADTSQRFSTQDQVAFSVINTINPTSVAENREYGGMVYRNSDGSFGATGPIRGELANVDPGGPSSVPGDTQATASWHTHGGNDPHFLNEEFSSADLSYSKFFSIDGYLGTPFGKFLLYDVNSNVVTQLGTVATQ